MQDRYEIPGFSVHPDDFSTLNGCTFDAKAHDQCHKKWMNNSSVLGLRGACASDGLAAAMAVNSKYANDSNIDLFIFGGPVNFTGSFPRLGDAAGASHKVPSWYTLQAHTRNKAGTVILRLIDALDAPIINSNCFDTGTTKDGAAIEDVRSLVPALNMSREALARYYHYWILLGTNFRRAEARRRYAE